MPFNDAQARYLLATLKYMDKNLASALDAATGEINDRDICPDYLLDVAAARAVALGQQIAHFHSASRRFIERTQIGLPPSISALAAFRTVLEFVQVSLDEIAPERLSNFGTLAPEGANEVVRLIDELSVLVNRMRAICRNPNLDAFC